MTGALAFLPDFHAIAPLFLCPPGLLYGGERRESVCNGSPVLANENVLTHPFLRPGTTPLGPDEQRRRTASRTTSSVLVAALHVVFFFAFVIGMRPFDWRNRPIIETILTLSSGDNQQRDRAINPLPMTKFSPNAAAPPITIPKPPPIHVEEYPPNAGSGPTDVLGAVGRELACSAGSWEHLTMVERQRCGLYPWRGARLPNGSLVMIPRNILPRLKEAPDTEFGVNTGADRMRAEVRSGYYSGAGRLSHPAEHALSACMSPRPCALPRATGDGRAMTGARNAKASDIRSAMGEGVATDFEAARLTVRTCLPLPPTIAPIGA